MSDKCLNQDFPCPTIAIDYLVPQLEPGLASVILTYVPLLDFRVTPLQATSKFSVLFTLSVTLANLLLLCRAAIRIYIAFKTAFLCCVLPHFPFTS